MLSPFGSISVPFVSFSPSPIKRNVYRSWAIPCSGKQVSAPRHRSEDSGNIWVVPRVQRSVQGRRVTQIARV